MCFQVCKVYNTLKETALSDSFEVHYCVNQLSKLSGTKQFLAGLFLHSHTHCLQEVLKSISQRLNFAWIKKVKEKNLRCENEENKRLTLKKYSHIQKDNKKGIFNQQHRQNFCGAYMEYY